MKVSLNWLKELVEIRGAGADVAAALTRAGVEVEHHARFGDFAGVVVAEVRGKKAHPQAAKLTLVDVFDGSAVTQVVCGAPNVPEPGALVLWAKPGARLPDGRVLEPKEVRGIVSPGMLCAEDELGLGESHEGILVFSAKDGLQAGDDAGAALGLPDEIFTLNLTPNRADCLGHLGVAREVAALTGWPLRAAPELLAATVQTIEGPKGGTAADGAPLVELVDAEGCPRYAALVLEGLCIGPSPLAAQLRLKALGVRAISNIVDATNLVMLERGQPLHAFDADRLRGPRIVVRAASAGERMTTLDDKERVLEAGDLLICDAERPVALAGVMGGASSEVHDGTTRVLLESALFAPSRIRRTARRVALQTEASHRFERGVDPEGVVSAALRCGQLLAAWAGARAVGPLVDVVAKPEVRRPVTVRFRPARTDALLGVTIPPDEQRTILERLGVAVTPSSPAEWQATAPTTRRDLVREVDLVEEIARVVGYDRIPATVPSLVSVPAVAGDRVGLVVREALRGLGFEEVITYGFIGPKQLGALTLPEGDPRTRPVLLENPLREELSVMRTTLIPGLVEVAARNLSRGVEDFRIGELGVVFLPRRSDGPLPHEERHLAGLLVGAGEGWLRPGAPLDVFDAKGAVEELLGAIGWGARFAPSAEPWLHPGLQAAVEVDGVGRGFVGELHPDYRRRVGLEVGAYAFELVVEGLPLRAVEARGALPRFPGAVRDLSFFVDATVPAEAVREEVARAGEPLLDEVRVLEDYREPTRVPVGKKGMLWTFSYRSPDRTLTDAEVNEAHARLRARLETALHITPR